MVEVVKQEDAVDARTKRASKLIKTAEETFPDADILHTPNSDILVGFSPQTITPIYSIQVPNGMCRVDLIHGGYLGEAIKLAEAFKAAEDIGGNWYVQELFSRRMKGDF